jgi:hypothetical protein
MGREESKESASGEEVKSEEGEMVEECGTLCLRIVNQPSY